MKEKIIEIISNYVDNKNSRNVGVKYSVNFQRDNSGELASDYRMELAEYRENSLTVMAISCEKVVAKATLFIMPYEVYEKVAFWELKIGNQELIRKRLIDVKKNIGEYCATFAFGEIKQDIRDEQCIALKYDIIKFYMGLCEMLLHDFGFFCYLEPTGINRFDELWNEYDYVNCNDTGIDINKLGRINRDSIGAEKIAKYLGMEKQECLFHGITGGPIYFSK